MAILVDWDIVVAVVHSAVTKRSVNKLVEWEMNLMFELVLFVILNIITLRGFGHMSFWKSKCFVIDGDGWVINKWKVLSVLPVVIDLSTISMI